MGALRGVDTDYDKMYRWCKEHAWKPVIHHEGGHSDTWQCNAALGQVPGKVLVVGDVSRKPGDRVWGLGAVVADIRGEILWEGEAWLHTSYTAVQMYWRLR